MAHGGHGNVAAGAVVLQAGLRHPWAMTLAALLALGHCWVEAQGGASQSPVFLPSEPPPSVWECHRLGHLPLGFPGEPRHTPVSASWATVPFCRALSWGFVVSNAEKNKKQAGARDSNLPQP